MTTLQKISLAGCLVLLTACTKRASVVTPSTPAKSVVPATSGSPAPKATGGSTSITPVYKLSDISLHANTQDCWTVISGNVYNLTAFINRHPGGQIIATICGKDGTAAFQAVGHSQRADNLLAGMQIGVFQP